MHPLTIAVWIVLSSIFVQYMDWLPRNDIGVIPYLGYFTPLPAFGAIGVPVLFLVDW